MKKNYNLRRLKTKKSYSTQELAEAIGVHIQTIRSWRKDGLQSIDDSSHYALYLGSAVQSYLRQKRQSRRVKLKPNEFYCLGCHAKTISNQTTIVSQNKYIGKGKDSIRIEGICVRCSKKVNRFDSREPKISITARDINTGLSRPL